MGNLVPLQCPFCGSRDIFVDYSDVDMAAQVRCAGCHATGPMTPFGVLAAITAWNNVAACVDPAAPRDIEGAENAPSCTGRGPSGPNSDNEDAKSPIRCEPTETVDSPAWYTSGGVETIEKVEAVVEGLPAREAYLLGQVVRYVDRAGMKDEAAIDLGKANNYAHRLVGGKWRDHE